MGDISGITAYLKITKYVPCSSKTPCRILTYTIITAFAISALLSFVKLSDFYTKIRVSIPYPKAVAKSRLQERETTTYSLAAVISATPNKPKVILSWRPVPGWDFMHLRDYAKPVFKSIGCKVDNCIYTEKKSLADKSDAIVFIGRSLGSKPQKLPHQRWIWVTLESSCYTEAAETGGVWAGMFNWTISFRRDSTFFLPYGYAKKRSTPITKNFTKIALKKTKKVAWMVSDCGTRGQRERYASELKKYISVDVYGACGPFKCSKRDNEKCLDNISNDYKFYLSFENSISTDYVTEKFWKMFDRDIVTVTRGPANYSRAGIKPEWHINTNDFKSPKDLADYLKYLDGNVKAYVKYLEWKNQYVGLFPKADVYCDLCAKLNDPSEPVTWYPPGQLAKWFIDGHCIPPNDLNFNT
ncbi:glycoprotein 3-alpha-L-fucosyltransferase A-like [Lingula anatina]|uniref:Fucosyltransferase n=1 Tax=Lingula anatina TaxID=7574 RepID=A0A1S3JD76_LINAN|nr:glycoprotein 3-alpha-L-fucosyltransferase A-like [Lingula anatina]|eukprot:XP_013408126.1 glycoprotein 3-alpha-L-fucosyltransferase A-like [Lingula anatina]